MTLDEIAALLEKNSVKWVPIIEDGQLGGTSDTKKQAVRPNRRREFAPAMTVLRA